MQSTGISTEKVAYTLIIIIASVFIIIISKPILAPLIFASLFALLLTPLCNKVEEKVPNRIISILIAFILAVFPFTLLITVFSLQFSDIIKDIGSLRQEFVNGLLARITSLTERFGLSITDGKDWIVDNLSGIVDAPLSFMIDSIGTSTYILTGIILTIIFTFMMLLYRHAAKQFFKIQLPPAVRDEGIATLNNIQSLTQRYLYGILVVMIILAFANSIGLLIIGIKYAIFWGCLAAFLALIPYIGTFLGGLFPLVFALATTGNLWQPAAVVVLFSSIQFIEGNLLTPKIVGNSVSINPLIAIVALFAGGMIWGISGMILAIPVFGVFNTILGTFDPLKPMSLLFGNKLYGREIEFAAKYDADRFRLLNLFKGDKND